MKEVKIYQDVIGKIDANLLINWRKKIEEMGNLKFEKTKETLPFFQMLEKKITPYATEYLKGTVFEGKVSPFDCVELIMEEIVADDNLHYDSKIEEKDGLTIAPIVCLLYLNSSGDDFEGGQLYFPFQKTIVNPKVGTLAIFPTGQLYPHKVLPFIGGKRYVLKVFYYINSELNEVDRNCLISQIKGKNYD